MKVSKSRILSLLGCNGFKLGASNDVEPSFSFVRPDQQPELFQWISVHFSGKRKEWVYSRAEVSVTQIIGFKGLTDNCLLNEAIRVTTIKEATSWEEWVARIGPPRAAELAREIGPGILARTESARGTAKKYFKHISSEKALCEQIDYYRKTCKSGLIKEAERLAEWPGVMQEFEAEEAYLLAALCILCLEKEVEGGGLSFLGADPLENDELMWRIQLVADRLVSWQEKRTA